MQLYRLSYTILLVVMVISDFEIHNFENSFKENNIPKDLFVYRLLVR